MLEERRWQIKPDFWSLLWQNNSVRKIEKFPELHFGQRAISKLLDSGGKIAAEGEDGGKKRTKSKREGTRERARESKREQERTRRKPRKRKKMKETRMPQTTERSLNKPTQTELPSVEIERHVRELCLYRFSDCCACERGRETRKRERTRERHRREAKEKIWKRKITDGRGNAKWEEMLKQKKSDCLSSAA